MKCTKCGCELGNVHGNRKYCLRCAKIADREQHKRNSARRYVHHPLQPTKCEMCGKTIKRKVANKKYCSECRKIKHKGYVRRYYERNRAAILDWQRKMRQINRDNDGGKNHEVH